MNPTLQINLIMDEAVQKCQYLAFIEIKRLTDIAITNNPYFTGVEIGCGCASIKSIDGKYWPYASDIPADAFAVLDFIMEHDSKLKLCLIDFSYPS